MQTLFQMLTSFASAGRQNRNPLYLGFYVLFIILYFINPDLRVFFPLIFLE